jgi:WD40 repeat protein
LAFSEDGSLIATGGRDGRIVLWNLHSQKPMAEFTEYSASRSVPLYVDRVLLLGGAGAKTVLSAGDDGRVLQWRVSREYWRDQACKLAGRDFTDRELRQYSGYLDDSSQNEGKACNP